MRYPFVIVALTALVPMQPSALAATYSDPSWPCIQRKVEDLSLGIMWPHPIGDEKIAASLQPAAGDLAAKLALRRISLEEAKPLVAEFAKTHPATDRDVFGQIFKMVFDRLSADRRKIIAGIEKYSFKQIALSKDIDKTRGDVASLMKAGEPDYDKIDQLEEKLDWDERVYRDRAQSLTYVCETPILLEKRLYAIAQLLLGYSAKE